MSNFLNLVSTLREQMQAELSRSDVLRVLIWPILILLMIFVSAVYAHAPNWALIGIAIFAAIFLLIYAASFGFLLMTDRDSLRSERYSLQKMAIEHGILGDSTRGIVDLPGNQISMTSISAPIVTEEQK